MDDITPSPDRCIARVREIIVRARDQAVSTVNSIMVCAYWRIGREIVEEEQRGRNRAEYGASIMEQLSERLTCELGRGYSVGNLRLIRQFYLTYRDRRPEIRDSVSRESDSI